MNSSYSSNRPIAKQLARLEIEEILSPKQQQRPFLLYFLFFYDAGPRTPANPNAISNASTRAGQRTLRSQCKQVRQNTYSIPHQRVKGQCHKTFQHHRMASDWYFCLYSMSSPLKIHSDNFFKFQFSALGWSKV